MIKKSYTEYGRHGSENFCVQIPLWCLKKMTIQFIDKNKPRSGEPLRPVLQQEQTFQI
jgi:hypothetical protein